MQRIDHLIRALYTPGAEELQEAQRELQRIQRSTDGWQFAQELLATNDANAQFLGAQTFLVQLNRRSELGAVLPPLQQQRVQLMQWLQTAMARKYSAFVIRKLLQVVVKLFLISTHWQEGISIAINIVGPGSPLCFDLLNTLVEDSDLSATELRTLLVPGVSDMVISLISDSKLANVEAICTLEKWACKYFDLFKQFIPDVLMLIVHNWSLPDNSKLCEAALACVSSLSDCEYRSWPLSTKKRLAQCLETLLFPISPDDIPSALESEKFILSVQLLMNVSEQDFEYFVQFESFLIQVACNPIPIVDDTLASSCIWFWTQYAEESIGNGLNVKKKSGSPTATVLEQVVMGYLPKLKLFEGLRDSDWDEFFSLRQDFGNFLELIYPIVGNGLFLYLTSIVLNAIPALDWFTIEVGLFCLNSLADVISEDYEGATPELDSMQQIFQSELWSKLQDCCNIRVRQTAVNLIGNFVDYFTTSIGKSSLAAALTYLFNCLSVQQLQITSSRSIQKLCDVCREPLINEIFNFINVYEQIRNGLYDVPHFRTVLGISYIIQVQPNLETKAEVLDQLLDLVLTMEPVLPDPKESEFMQLKCVAAIGKGLKNQSTDENDSFISEFWSHNKIALRIRDKLQSIINLIIPATNLIAIEAICDIVKCGINETGPYMLHEPQIISFVSTKIRAGPMNVISPVLELAKFYVSTRLCAYRAHKGKPLQAESLYELMLILRFDYDDSAVSAAIDLLTQLAATVHALQLNLASLGSLTALKYVYTAVGSADRFISKSCSSFWKEFLENESLTEEQASALISVILLQISGKASRSELGSVVNVLKLLMSRHTLITSSFLERMLVDAPEIAAIQQQDIKTRSDFLTQLQLLKGGRKTFDVTQKFWMKCRNIPEKYDPIS